MRENVLQLVRIGDRLLSGAIRAHHVVAVGLWAVAGARMPVLEMPSFGINERGRKVTPERICAGCVHLLSEHCKGHVEHGDHKEEARMVRDRKKTVTCQTRHCNEPLCCCLEFL